MNINSIALINMAIAVKQKAKFNKFMPFTDYMAFILP